jgi:hypothetical protein
MLDLAINNFSNRGQKGSDKENHKLNFWSHHTPGVSVSQPMGRDPDIGWGRFPMGGITFGHCIEMTIFFLPKNKVYKVMSIWKILTYFFIGRKKMDLVIMNYKPGSFSTASR